MKWTTFIVSITLCIIIMMNNLDPMKMLRWLPQSDSPDLILYSTAHALFIPFPHTYYYITLSLYLQGTKGS